MAEPEAGLVEVWENQRFYVFRGWSSNLFRTDRPAWSDERGQKEVSRESVELPSNLFEWDGDWSIDCTDADKKGWRYALDFPSTKYTARKGLLDYVRRRRWIRTYHRRDLVAELAAQHNRPRADSLDGLLSELRLSDVPNLHDTIVSTMEKFDLDKDGKLSRTELALFLCSHPLVEPHNKKKKQSNDDDDDDEEELKGLGSPVLSKQISTGEGRCQICLSGGLSCACVPCGHLVMCSECGPKVIQKTGECPICREAVSGHLHVFM